MMDLAKPVKNGGHIKCLDHIYCSIASEMQRNVLTIGGSSTPSVSSLPLWLKIAFNL